MGLDTKLYSELERPARREMLEYHVSFIVLLAQCGRGKSAEAKDVIHPRMPLQSVLENLVELEPILPFWLVRSVDAADGDDDSNAARPISGDDDAMAALGFSATAMLVRGAYLKLLAALFLDGDDEQAAEILSNHDALIWFDPADVEYDVEPEDASALDGTLHALHEDPSDVQMPPASLMQLIIAELEVAAAHIKLDGRVPAGVTEYMRDCLVPVATAYLTNWKVYEVMAYTVTAYIVMAHVVMPCDGAP